MCRTGSSSLVSKRISRLVTMPTNCPLSTTGTPEILRARVSLITSPMVVSGLTVNGSRITPASKFLTLATCVACSLKDIFLCKMPMPPNCAMAMAKRASVTVSMAADTIGKLMRILRVSCVAKRTSLGKIIECAGTRETSSNVRASARMRSIESSELLKQSIIPNCVPLCLLKRLWLRKLQVCSA